ncbi:MAG: hypothetical protein U1E72_18685, partial [Burkholderiaceae bacterium]
VIMGMFWQFFSFDPQRWEALVTGQVPDAKKYFAASATWDQVDDDFPDPEEQPKQYLDALWKSAQPEVAAMAQHIALNGISYRGLTTASAALLDSMVVGFFCREGLESVLHFTIEHKDGLSPKAVSELLSRSQPARTGGFLGFGSKVSLGQPVNLSPWLATGRRNGTNDAPTPDDKYFIFSGSEARELLTEVTGLLAIDRQWQTPEFERHIRRELLPAIERAAGANLCLAGRYT